MSRTQRKGGNTSPIKHYLQFSGSTGTFSYYDKAAKERVDLEQIEIIVLDVRASVTGYNSTSKAQITSNMVADISSEKLKVTSWKDKKSTNIAEGLYKNIKNEVTSKSVGGKFTTNVICLCDVTGEGQEVCNLQLTGSALNSWIKFIDTLEKGGEYDNVITLKQGALSVVDGKVFRAVTPKEEKDLDAKLKKNPRAPRPIWFYVVDFETVELSEDEADLAIEQDSILQAYFEGATATKAETSEDEDGEDVEDEKEQSAPDDAEGEDKEKLPF